MISFDRRNVSLAHLAPRLCSLSYNLGQGQLYSSNREMKNKIKEFVDITAVNRQLKTEKTSW